MPFYIPWLLSRDRRGTKFECGLSVNKQVRPYKLWGGFSFCPFSRFDSIEAPRSQGGASRARSGEQAASKGSFVYIVPLDPASKAALVGHVPVSARSSLRR